MYIFSDETYFSNGISINFLFWIHVLSFFLRLFYLSTSSLFNFNLSASSLPIILNFLLFQALTLSPSALIVFPSFQIVSNFFLFFFGCCKYWLTLYKERHAYCIRYINEQSSHYVLNKLGNQEINSHIHNINISRLFHVLTNFPFTTSETMRDYYYKHGIYKLPQELPNDLRLKYLRKLGNIRKVSKLHKMVAQCPISLPK